MNFIVFFDILHHFVMTFLLFQSAADHTVVIELTLTMLIPDSTDIHIMCRLLFMHTMAVWVRRTISKAFLLFFMMMRCLRYRHQCKRGDAKLISPARVITVIFFLFNFIFLPLFIK